MVMSQCFVSREGAVIATAIYPHVCVCARLWVLCIYCVCEWSCGTPWWCCDFDPEPECHLALIGTVVEVKS